MEFQHKVVAITGAAGGIGQELCRHFGKEGAAIVALDRSESITSFAERLRADGTRIEAAVVDIVDADAVRLAFARIGAILGPVDILINNAGVSTQPEPGAHDACWFQRRRQRESERGLQLHSRRAA